MENIYHSDIYNFVLADKDMKVLEKHGADRNRLIKIKNGIMSYLFSFEPKPEKGDKTLYLGKIDERKLQYKYQMKMMKILKGFLSAGPPPTYIAPPAPLPPR